MGEAISSREFARRAGCHERQVRRAIDAGRLKRDAQGHLDADLLKTDWRKPNRTTMVKREKAATAGRAKAPPAGKAPPPEVPLDEDGRLDDEALFPFIEKLLTGRFVDYATALRIKENALALKHLLTARQQAGELMEIDKACEVMFEMARAQRDSWMNWPVRIGPMLAEDLHVDHGPMVEALNRYVHDHLVELGEPDGTEMGEAPSPVE